MFIFTYIVKNSLTYLWNEVAKNNNREGQQLKIKPAEGQELQGHQPTNC